MSGKIESVRTTSSAGHRKTLRGARMLASPLRRRSTIPARPDAPRPDPGDGIGPRGSSEEELALDSKARLVGRELRVSALGVRDLLPAVIDLLDRRVPVDLAREELRDGLVEDDLLILLGLRDPHVEDHVGTLEARLDGAEVVLGRLLAHPGLEPRARVRELRGAVRIEPGLADRHVDVRLLWSTDVGEERVGRVLDLLVDLAVDGAGPAPEGGERRVVDPVDG